MWTTLKLPTAVNANHSDNYIVTLKHFGMLCVHVCAVPPVVVRTVQQLLSRLHVLQEKLSAGFVVIDAAGEALCYEYHY